ncbi:MAG TPA: nitrate reductase molybdenum cofactor assembly chaperone [Ktedonobacterales bacterium]|jgi:nitrate reductase delta subunit|nr:nitrate reductase molybdenum cofactor assembly chaperone [Ktedonobacterales bacterium]
MAHQQTGQGARDDPRSGVFVAAARLLAYPDEALGALLPEVEAYLRALPASEPVSALVGVAERLHAMSVVELEALYVATFDFDESAALYLTAHELGDSRRRGQALIELRRLLRAAGFEQATAELPDYLPLLLEFLAQAPAAPAPIPEGVQDPIDALERRLAAVCERIAGRLSTDNPYCDLFAALRGLFPTPEETNTERRFSQREQADTGEMPYPLHYD